MKTPIKQRAVIQTKWGEFICHFYPYDGDKQVGIDPYLDIAQVYFEGANVTDMLESSIMIEIEKALWEKWDVLVQGDAS